MKKKVIIYGIGSASSKYLKNIEEEWEIVAVSDQHSKCEMWNGYPFIAPSQLKDYEYDYVVVPSSKYYSEICKVLEKIGVYKERIIKGWYKNVSEFSYWKKMQEQEGNFINDKYKEVMLCLAEEDDGQPQSFDKNVINLLKNNYDVVSVRIAKRASNTGEYFEPYSHMLHGQYADDLKENEKGFLWFRAIKINKSTDEK